MRYYVFSTLTCDHNYTNWNPPPETKSLIRTIRSQVLIKGGANLANVDNPRLAPKGVMTEVTEQQMAELDHNSVFQKHKKRGFIVVTMSKADPEQVARQDMAPKDNSAPLTPDSAIFQREGEESIKPMAGSKVKGALGAK